jgi:dihydrofolate synthase/folylpolyglutamate synthase
LVSDKYGKSGEKEKAPERFGVLAALLGVPDKRIKYVHAAGTNGKGSVCGFIASALVCAGKKTGKFTSPHLADITERITVNGANITKADLARLCEKADRAAEDSGCAGFSRFEILAASALMYFSEVEADYAVIETGIGGLLDCTGVIMPEVSVITRVSLDHTDILGDTVEKIARHKAGVIKANVPCVVYPLQYPETMNVMAETAANLNAPLVIPDLTALDISESSVFRNVFFYKGREFRIKTGGEHQIYNAVTAAEALSVLGVNAAGIAKARIPARLQIISENPAVILDGAHNPDGLHAARKAVEGLPGKKVVVAGMLKTKNYRDGLKELIVPGGTVILTDGFSTEAAPCGELAAVCREYGAKRVLTESDENRAVSLARELAGDDGTVLISGSLYLAGKILRG